MGIEANTGPSDQTIEKMDKTWPLGTDTRSFWDDHARFIKAVLKNIFPGVGGNGFSIPITATEAEINQLHGVSLATKLVTPKVDTSQAANVASAATIDLESISGETVIITGTTAITAITLGQGHTRTVVFSGTLVLTNGISLVLPGNANITTTAGDVAVFSAFGTGGTTVRCISYTKASGLPIAETPNSFKSGVFTKNMTDVSGTQTVTGLGFTPKFIKFTVSYAAALISSGAYDSSTNTCVYCVLGGASNSVSTESIHIESGAGIQGAVVSAVASGQFTLTWTKTSAPTGSAYISWEAWS